MSENLEKLYLHYNPITTKTGAAARISFLFHEIEEAHGLDEARRMFARWATPPTASETIKLKGWRLIEMYDAMKEPNVREMARQVGAIRCGTGGRVSLIFGSDPPSVHSFSTV
jgi:hypothetical protein